MFFRLVTENKNYDRTIKLVQRFFTGFTILKGIGFWNRQKEDCLIIEVSGATKKDIMFLAEQIKLQNNQEAVMIQQIKGITSLI